MRVVERGMPGSAMFPFGHLGEAERQSWSHRCGERIRAGLEDRLRREAKEFGEQVDPKELAKTHRPADTARAPARDPPRSAGARG